MIKKLAPGNAFCVLPWIEKLINLTDERQFCCWSDVMPESITSEVRQQIWEGKKVPQCESCYKLEEKNVVSPRQQENSLWLKDPDVQQHFNSTVCPSYKPFFFDIRLNNKCNLACIGCGPNSSSLWAKELGINDITKKNIVDVNELLQAKKVYISGGEPFLIDEYIQIINAIANNNPDSELHINTNLTSVPEETFNDIKKIKKVTVIVSLDSYDKVNEYHRYPMRWDKFMRNLNKLKSIGVRIVFNTVIDAVSVFGFEKLHLLEDYADGWALVTLTWPAELRLNNVPNDLKELATANLQALKKIRFYKTDIKFKSKVDRALELVNEKGNSTSLSAYIQTLDQRRRINHTEYLGVNLIET